MDPAFRIATRLPLKELWRDDGFTSTSRQRRLGTDDIVSLLRLGRVEFVVADVGMRLHWVPLNDCFDFWKAEVRKHVKEPELFVSLDEFPGNYFYYASEWSGGKEPIIVLEKEH